MSKSKGKSEEELLQEALVPEEEQPYPIPENWVWTRISFLSKVVSKGTSPPKDKGHDYTLTGVNFLRVENITKNMNVDLSNVKFIDSDTHNTVLKRSIAQENDVLISIAGSLGRLAIVNNEHLPCNMNQAIAFIRLSPIVIPKYVMYALASPYLNGELVKQQRTTAQPNLSLQHINEIEIPLPPYNEQKRIVDKVETLLNKINQAKQLIEEAKETFELRRAAIMDKAFRGELTSKWRRAKLEQEDTVEDLLSSISNIKLMKPQKISEHLINNLFNADFPDTWRMVKIEDLFYIVGGGTPSKSVIEYWTGDIPWVSPKDMKTFWVKSSLDQISREAINNSSVNLVKKGSIALVVRSGILQRTLPVAMLMQESTVNQDMKVFDSGIEEVNLYFMWYIVAYEKLLLKEYTKSGTTVNSIEFDKFKKHQIPLPPLSEIKEILENIKVQMGKQDEVNKKLQISEELEKLKQSILSKAFRGELGTTNFIEESSLDSIKQL